MDDKFTSDSNLWATYYSSTSLAAPVATRLAASIDFSGSSLSSQPVSSLVSGVGWSVRWSGFVRAPVAGGATWTFFIGLAQGGNGGDGVRGWVDGVAVVDGWGGIAGSEVSGTVVLSGASNSYYEVVVEYKAVGAAYGCTLSWEVVSHSKQILLTSSLFYIRLAEQANSVALHVVPGLLRHVSERFAMFWFCDSMNRICCQWRECCWYHHGVHFRGFVFSFSQYC